MIYIIAIVVFIFAVSTGILLYLRYRGSKIGGYTTKSPLFLSSEETIEFLGSRAKLDPEEKKMLEKLIEIGGTSRLHTALDGSEVGRRWVLNTRKAIYASLALGSEEKETLEYYLYELFRKISIARAAIHPQLVHIKNITLGQTLEVRLPKSPMVVGDFVGGNGKQAQIVFSEDQYRILEGAYTTRSKVLVSFWKEMDAGYAFRGEVEYLTEKKGVFEMSVKITTPLKRMKMRLYPRKEAEIPVRFRIGQMHVDQDSGALGEQFGRLFLGLVSDIGPKGGVVLTHFPISADTPLKMEFPILDTVIEARAVARSTRFYETIYSIGVEFTDIARKDVVEIYRFIYPDEI